MRRTKSHEFEARWLKFIRTCIKDNGFISKSEAVNGGALIAGCSISTTHRYVLKYTSVYGEFKRTWEKGREIIVLRNQSSGG